MCHMSVQVHSFGKLISDLFSFGKVVFTVFCFLSVTDRFADNHWDGKTTLYKIVS